MRTITKGAEPESLMVHRQTPHCDYDNYADKAALRRALVAEQRSVCCYCMQRIRDNTDSMKIEHWLSQRHHETEQLNYRNLLGACLGGQGQPPNLQHCDTRKGDSALRWNPANPAHHIETKLRYEMDGSIRSLDPAFDTQIDDVLNINIEVLKNNRKAVWIAIVEWWSSEKARRRGPVPRAIIQRERDRRVNGDDALPPFCQVAVWWLDQRLARMGP